MKRVILALFLAVSIWTVAATARSQEKPADPPHPTGLVAEPEPVADTSGTPADTNMVFTIEVGNRLYPGWKEVHEVRINEEFPLGDTEFFGLVRRFMSDFRLKDGAPINFSTTLDNPAVYVFTYGDTAAVDSSWAFLNFPPHFSPRSFFAYQLKDVRGYQAPPTTNEEKEAN